VIEGHGLSENKKAVETGEGFHGLDLLFKYQQRANLSVRLHHHQFRFNILFSFIKLFPMIFLLSSRSRICCQYMFVPFLEKGLLNVFAWHPVQKAGLKRNHCYCNVKMSPFVQ